jgi:hypothetical protein
MHLRGHISLALRIDSRTVLKSALHRDLPPAGATFDALDIQQYTLFAVNHQRLVYRYSAQLETAKVVAVLAKCLKYEVYVRKPR